MRVDLPAPFSPISACISPRRAVNSTFESAFTPGKLLLTPDSARSGAGCVTREKRANADGAGRCRICKWLWRVRRSWPHLPLQNSAGVIGLKLHFDPHPGGLDRIE